MPRLSVAWSRRNALEEVEEVEVEEVEAAAVPAQQNAHTSVRRATGNRRTIRSNPKDRRKLR